MLGDEMRFGLLLVDGLQARIDAVLYEITQAKHVLLTRRFILCGAGQYGVGMLFKHGKNRGLEPQILPLDAAGGEGVAGEIFVTVGGDTNIVFHANAAQWH